MAPTWADKRTRGLTDALTSLVLLRAGTSAMAQPQQEAIQASTDFFTRMSAHDVAGTLRYVSNEGIIEISPNSPAVHHLGADAYQALLVKPWGIDIRVADR